MRFLRKTALGWGLLAAAFWAVPTFAVPINSGEGLELGEIRFTLVGADGVTPLWQGDYTGHDDPTNPDPNVLTIYDGSGSVGGINLQWWDVGFDLDPGVNGVWAITNNTGATQILSLIVDVPVAPVAPSSLMSGSTSISIADANFSGAATLATVGVTAMYNGRIDFGPVTPATDLFAAPFSLPAPPGGTASATMSFGVFPGSVPGPAVAGFIGIQHVFSLTAGDTATFNSTFHVVVPEPGTLLLLGSGLVLLVVRRSN